MKKRRLLALSVVAVLASAAVPGFCQADENAAASGDVVEVVAVSETEDGASGDVIEVLPSSGTGDEVVEVFPEDADISVVSVEEDEELTDSGEDAAVPTAAEVLAQMNVGWNLGNTFDAWGASSVMGNETYWGNPKTTKEMIDAVRAQGFNTLRIPVTWAQSVGEAPDYTIDSEWLDRVAEVVDYAYDEGMFVIIDTHHEPDFWLIPQPENAEEIEAELTAIWAQISERFADYDYHLLFEGMNEPRTKGSAQEWSGGTDEERAIVNELNKAFVDTVRAAGGNNETRSLIICPYGNSVTYNSVLQLEVPEDPYVMVSAHLYTPYFFTYEPEGQSVNEWNGTLKKDIISNVDLLKRHFLSKDIPVIVTEFGAVHKTYKDADGNEVENTEQVLKWLADYMEVMNGSGIKCIWWDNGNYSGSGEKFGIFDRKNCSWYSQEIADALIENSQKASDQPPQ